MVAAVAGGADPRRRWPSWRPSARPRRRSRRRRRRSSGSGSGPGSGPGAAPAAAEVALAEENLARVTAAQQAQLAGLAGAQCRGGWPRRAAAAGRGPAVSYCRVRKAAAKVEPARERAAEAEREAAAKAAGPGPVRNITDPDSRLMPVRGGGFIQGYNTQNVTSEDGLVIATELTDDPADMAWFEPMMAQAEQAAALIEAHRPARPRPGAGERTAGRAGSGRRWPTPGTAPRPT